MVKIAPATLQRRVKSGHFTQNESARLYRLAQVFSSAFELFEQDESDTLPAYRLVKNTWSENAFDGEGAKPTT